MNLRLTSSALALAAMTAPAFADVTSEQVWQSWVDYYSSAGYQIKEGKREQAGDTLTITDVTVSTEDGDPATTGQMTLTVPQGYVAHPAFVDVAEGDEGVIYVFSADGAGS